MFDIICCEADAKSFGFERFFSPAQCKGKVLELDNLEAAVAHKNRKTLIMLKDWAFDEGAIRVIAEKKGACFLIDLGRLMKAKGVPRAIAISKLRNFLALCVKYGAYYSFATFAENAWEIRSQKEMESMITLLGLNRGQAKFALMMLGQYL